MKFRAVPIAILFSTVLLMMFTLPLPVNAAYGPRTEDLIIRFYSGVEAAYAALKACDIDAIGYEITADLYLDAIEDPNICVAPVGDMGFYEIDMNGNWTIADASGYENPIAGVQGVQMRKAFTLLLNRDFIVSDCCGGFANRIDQPIAYAHRSWRNQSYWYEDGTGWEFDPAAAAAIMDADGWTQGSTPNPYYDAAFPGSAQYIRTYPSRHSKAGQDLDPLKYCIRTDDLRCMCAGDLHKDNLRKHGIPINVVYGTSSVLSPIVMDNINYHLYTGHWSLSRFPPVYVYSMFHSSQFFVGGSNYVTGNDSNNQPNYPRLDVLLEEGRFPSSYSEAQTALKKTLGLGWGELFINIPMFSARSYWAWKCGLQAVVSGEGVGLENGYFFLNAYKLAGGPIVYGLKTPPLQLNIIYSKWYYDYQVLDRIYETGGVGVNPYDLSVDQSWWVQDWAVDTWIDPDDSLEKTRVTRWFREDGFFVEPVTGNQLEPVNSTHVYASMWYYYQTSDAWINSDVQGIKTLRMVDNHAIEIYWNNQSYWHTYLGDTYILSFNSFNKAPISSTVTENLTSDANGWFTTSQPAYWIISAEETGTPLTVGTDLDMYLDTRNPPGPHKCTIRMLDFGVHTVEITYLAKGDALGYTLGNVAWDEILEGHGMYYIVDHVPGTGGYATLKRNPYYWLETPILGDIDFLWHWSGTDESRRIDGDRAPRVGCYVVDILDVGIITSASGSQGNSVPDPNWFPGADLAPGGECCEINTFDVLTVTGVYGDSWGCTSGITWDVAVIDITTSKSGCLPLETTGEGCPVNVSVTLENQGNQETSFEVRAYANATEIMWSEIGLSPQETITWMFTWDTTGYAKGNYSISATAETVSGEIDTGDNTMIDGITLVTIPGDVDGDRDVDIYDIVRMAGVYMVSKPNPRYNPNCDIDNDGDIDIYDIVAAASNYHESW